ncbi:acyl-CoA dehydrogenase family protein [Aeromicrobium sp. HA]|uniref:acyl-CoA dehydrogenase family protein n=1 Tax=Aeromicrobium sp. HA TaxID=3009077 RepID=UPI0022B045CC|nr:acyl-CoA dehydrogenase family protein [Aeromicrobium sp. HA]
MEPLLDEHQQSYQRSLRRFLEKEWGPDRLRAAMEGPTTLERDVWRRLAFELGVAGLNIPEHHGGSGEAHAEALLVIEELGRALFGPIYVGTVVLASQTLLLCEDESAQAALFPGIADGTVTATLAWPDSGRDRTRAPLPRAVQSGSEWRLTGEVRRVVDGQSADRVLVVANTDAGDSVFLLSGEDGLERLAGESIDPTRRLATLVLDDAPAVLVGTPGGAPSVLDRLRPFVALHLAAEAVGGAAACVDQTVSYAKTREQFGSPIGAFQAVKHRCADMQVRLEGARAGVRYAGQAIVTGEEDLDVLSSVLKVYATRSYFRSAADMVQLHGGIGFTWEHSAHLHFKRAKSLELMAGSHDEHRELIARAVLDRVGS